MKVIETEVAVVGGGMIGAATGYGLSKLGLDTVILDEGDVAFRAARGNFGLVWVQSKGFGTPEYSKWSCGSADSWSEFATSLRNEVDIDVGHERKGGLVFCYSEEEFSNRARDMQAMADDQDGRFSYEMVEKKWLEGLFPSLGDNVFGASYCPQDGHVNPLYLLRALHAAFQRRGGRYLPNEPVQSITHGNNGFLLRTRGLEVRAKKILLAAGLANATLAPQVGLKQPVYPERGQILVTEKLDPCMGLPSIISRQTAEGSIMLGWSAEEVGLNEGTTASVMKDIANLAVTTFPFLIGSRMGRA